MKPLFIFLFISFYTSQLFALQWEYTLKDALITTVDKDGHKQHSIDIKVIDYFINAISPYARSYPPKIKNEQDKKEITDKLVKLSNMLETLLANQPKNIVLLTKAAFVHTMAHNVDIKGSFNKAKHNYEVALSIDTNSAKINYMYGMFLVNTKKYHYHSIPYLEKALDLGVDDARYTLGLLYYHQGNEIKGLEFLHTYAKDNPKNQHVKNIIEALKNKKLAFGEK